MHFGVTKFVKTSGREKREETTPQPKYGKNRDPLDIPLTFRIILLLH